MGKYQQNIENARRVGVIDFLQTCRPGELIRVTDKEYRTKTHSSLVISSNGLFHWFSMGVGGNNAIDYLTKVENMDFVSAVRLLNEVAIFPVSFQPAQQSARIPEKKRESLPFQLPAPDRNADAVAAYLQNRGISPKVIRHCVQNGLLYQTTRGKYRNCVFVGKDDAGQPRSAFLRGCGGTFRGDVAGSQKQYGFLLGSDVPASETVEVYEAPIDALSGATLRQYKHDSPWHSVNYLALGGLTYTPLDHYLDHHPVKTVTLCLDNDKPGRDFTHRLAAHLKPRGVEVLDTPPAVGKDYNDYLLTARHLISLER